MFAPKDITNPKILKKDPYWRAINASNAIIEFTPDGKIISANAKFLNLTGYDLADIKGKHHRIFCSQEENMSPEYQKFWEDLSNGVFSSGTYARFNRAGERVWLEATYNPIIKNNKVLKIIKIASNVTEKIEESQNSLFMINAIHRAMAVIEFDVHGKILSANENFSTVMGYSENEIRGKHHKMFCDSNLVKSSEYSNFWKDLNRGIYQSGQFPRITKNGKRVWLEATYNPVFDEFGNIIKIIKIAKDITQIVDNRLSDESNAQDVYSLTQCATNLTIENKQVLSVSSKKVEKVEEMMQESEIMMLELSKKIANINELVEKVKDISHQTHLLSLNASIEAATAGVHGKGFAVVAAEVKRLAGFTKEASEHISKVIESIKADTQNAVKKIHICAEQSHETNEASKMAQKGLEKVTIELDNLVDCVKKFSTISSTK